jgi:hypothetical protein
MDTRALASAASRRQTSQRRPGVGLPGDGQVGEQAQRHLVRQSVAGAPLRVTLGSREPVGSSPSSIVSRHASSVERVLRVVRTPGLRS